MKTLVLITYKIKDWVKLIYISLCFMIGLNGILVILKDAFTDCYEYVVCIWIFLCEMGHFHTTIEVYRVAAFHLSKSQNILLLSPIFPKILKGSFMDWDHFFHDPSSSCCFWNWETANGTAAAVATTTGKYCLL